MAAQACLQTDAYGSLVLQGHATSDHTTLLLNCYSKLKAIDKLESFLKRSAGDAATLHFDAEVAVKVGLMSSVRSSLLVWPTCSEHASCLVALRCKLMLLSLMSMTEAGNLNVCIRGVLIWRAALWVC